MESGTGLERNFLKCLACENNEHAGDTQFPKQKQLSVHCNTCTSANVRVMSLIKLQGHVLAVTNQWMNPMDENDNNGQSDLVWLLCLTES